jgi:hypothetical protein
MAASKSCGFPSRSLNRRRRPIDSPLLSTGPFRMVGQDLDGEAKALRIFLDMTKPA